jgi:hypothetical protein
MRPLTATLLALTVLASAGTAAGRKSDARVQIVNNARYAIHQLYLSSTTESEWGPDQLEEATIESGETFTLRRIPCDRYDIRLVDEDQDACVIRNVPLCGGSEDWEITDETLLACQQASR